MMSVPPPSTCDAATASSKAWRGSAAVSAAEASRSASTCAASVASRARATTAVAATAMASMATTIEMTSHRHSKVIRRLRRISLASTTRWLAPRNSCSTVDSSVG